MSGRRTPSVLVVEGDAQLAAQIAAHLAQSGIQARHAADGYDAVRAVQARSYDLILLGLQLRDRDGAEVLRLLRLDPHTASTPVYVVAAHGDSELLGEALRVGAQGVFRRDRQTPDMIAFEVAALLGAPTGARAPTAPPGNVPADVDAVAQRFRSGRRAPTAPADPAAPGADPTPAVKTDLPDGFHGRYRFQPTRRAGATPTYYVPQEVPAPPRPASAAGPGSVLRDTGESPAHGHAAGGGAAPPRSPQVPPQQVFSYDTLLNHLVGQAPYLAEAMGLRPDFLCTACGAQLTLRIWPDAERPNGVRGYFFCSRCDPQ